MSDNGRTTLSENATRIMATVEQRGGTALLGAHYFARHLGIEPELAEAALDELVEAKKIRERGSSYLVIQPSRRRDPHHETLANLTPGHATT